MTVCLPGGCQALCPDHTPTTIINVGAGTRKTTAASNPWLCHSICLQVNLSFAVTLWHWPFLAYGEMWFIFRSVIGDDERERRREVFWGFLKPMQNISVPIIPVRELLKAFLRHGKTGSKVLPHPLSSCVSFLCACIGIIITPHVMCIVLFATFHEYMLSLYEWILSFFRARCLLMSLIVSYTSLSSDLPSKCLKIIMTFFFFLQSRRIVDLSWNFASVGKRKKSVRGHQSLFCEVVKQTL